MKVTRETQDFQRKGYWEMHVTRKITNNNVTKCSECPWFMNHPHEPSCDLKRELSETVPRYRGYGNLCARSTIDKDCPIKGGLA